MPITRQAQRIFQSTPPRGWRRYVEMANATAKIFQSTPPRGWRRYPPYQYSCVSPYFNPLHHEGGDLLASTAPLKLTVFQSTPPRGWRQRDGGDCLADHVISIHSTTRVETSSDGAITADIIKFQSTPPRGWRLQNQRGFWEFQEFQSTPPRGWRQSEESQSMDLQQFQSTPPRGWRQFCVS